jgi:hypothetical protein
VSEVGTVPYGRPALLGTMLAVAAACGTGPLPAAGGSPAWAVGRALTLPGAGAPVLSVAAWSSRIGVAASGGIRLGGVPGLARDRWMVRVAADRRVAAGQVASRLGRDLRRVGSGAVPEVSGAVTVRADLSVREIVLLALRRAAAHCPWLACGPVRCAAYAAVPGLWATRVGGAPVSLEVTAVRTGPDTYRLRAGSPLLPGG